MIPSLKRMAYGLSGCTGLLLALPLTGQTQSADDAEPAFELNPFEVNSSTDRGYLATNQISGTRVNVAIKDTPVSIEILTSEFLEDTGATSFNEALAYSAGIFTDTVISGATADLSPSSSARVGDRRNNAIIIRGFNAPFQQRMGFRIGSYIGVRGGSTGQGSTGRGGVTLGATIDNVNVDRYEIVRGPGALLYGLGVISGIANILPKEPLSEFMTRVELGVGSDDFLRGSLDTTGPLLRKDDGSPLLDYRLMGAMQERGDWTDHFLESRDYYAGQVKWYPFRGMSLFVELSKAETLLEGLGSRTIRDNNDDDWRDPWERTFTNAFGEPNEWGRDDFSGRYPAIWDSSQWPDIWNTPPDPARANELQPMQGPFNSAAARITGPDTYYEREEWSALARLNWKLTDRLALSIGAFHTEQDIEEFMVTPFVINDSYGTWRMNPADGDRTADQVFIVPNPAEQVPGDRDIYRGIGTYWTLTPTDAESTQFQADLRYEFETPFFFTESSAIHSLLFGRQDVQDIADIPVGNPSSAQITGTQISRTPNDPLRLRSFYDWGTPIRYDDEPLVRPASDYYTAKLWYQGHYGVYHGRFFDERIGLIGGLRHDRFQAHEERWTRENFDATNQRTGTADEYYNFEEAVTVTTGSLGVTLKITEALNLYGVVAEGVIPNTGQRDGTGASILPEQTLSKEIGIKFDFFRGKVSGAISVFQIDRENAIWNYTRAPAPGKWTGGNNPFVAGHRFDPELVIEGGAPISYGVAWQTYFRDLVNDPEEGEKWRNKLGLIQNPRTGRLQVAGERPPGILDITFADGMNLPDEQIVDDLRPYVYLDYHHLQNDPDLHAVMEKAFQDFSSGDHPEAIDPIKYSGDWANTGLNASLNSGAAVTFEEEVKGFEAQFIVTPLNTDNLQFIFNFSHVKREATSPFQLVRAEDWRHSEYGQLSTEYDIWVKDFGRDAFDDPKDPTTLRGGIEGQSLYFGSENTASFWGRYTFTEGAFSNLGFGLGVRYVGSAQTHVPIGGANLALNRYPTPDTEPYVIFDGAIYYRKSFEKFDLNIRLNLYNLGDKHELYGEVEYPNVDYPEVTERRRTLAYIQPFHMRLSANFTF